MAYNNVKEKKEEIILCKIIGCFYFCGTLHMSLEFSTNFAELDFTISLKICKNKVPIQKKISFVGMTLVMTLS